MIELPPDLKAAADRIKYTPTPAAIAMLGRALAELLHLELHVQLDELTTKEISSVVADQIRQAIEALKGCEVILQRDRTLKISTERRKNW